MATTRRFVNVVSLSFMILYVINSEIRSTSAADLADCFEVTEDVHGFYGIPHHLTITKCLEVCLKNSSCVGVDWEPTNKENKTCWILPSTSIKSTTQTGVITHYELKRRGCLNTQFPTPARATTTDVSSDVSNRSLGVSVTTEISGNASSPPAPPWNVPYSGVQQVHAIRPAYIVLAGLGAGNLLLVVIAIVIICSYPLHRSQYDKNEVNNYRAHRNDVDGGGGGGYEHHEMRTKHNDDDDDGYHDDRYDTQHQDEAPPYRSSYADENEMNNKRYTTTGYEEPAMSVEDNPYFNRSEIEAASSPHMEASAAF